jgi:hypothetical protein
MDIDDWDPPGRNDPSESPNVWALTSAARRPRATYPDTPALPVWDFVRRSGLTS